MVSRVAQRFGGVDILVNNAGVTGLAKLADSDPGHWREIMDVNLFGTYHCCQAVLPHLLHRGGGKIVNMGSDSSVIGYPLFGAYAASKHAVLGLTKSLAEEVKGHNIQVNAVCPAFVDTAMTPAAFRKAAIPTEQVAEVVAFLASAAADGITGEPIRVFGRQDMYWYGSGKMSLVQAVAS
jgi:NAD(P)-dependent dehydrogenase (short-subunit alcohol dehydrogenase family)